MYDRLLKLLAETQGELDFSGPDKEAAKKAKAEEEARLANTSETPRRRKRTRRIVINPPTPRPERPDRDEHQGRGSMG